MRPDSRVVVSEPDCWALLASQSLGRLGLSIGSVLCAPSSVSWRSKTTRPAMVGRLTMRRRIHDMNLTVMDPSRRRVETPSAQCGTGAYDRSP